MTTNPQPLKFTGLLFFFCCYCMAFTQVPLGLPIALESSIEAIRLSADGNSVVVVRSVINLDNDREGLRVNIYEWDGTEWLSLGESPILIEAADSWSTLHTVIASGGNHVAVYSKYVHDFNATFLSAVKVFGWTGSNWEQVGENLPAATSIDFSTDGSRIALGKPFLNTYDLGTAEIHEWNGDTWQQMGQTFEGRHEWEHLGKVNLSGDGNRLAIASSGYENGPAQEKGIIRTYDWDGTDWTPTGTQNEIVGPVSTFSLSANGDRIRRAGASGLQVDQFDWNGEGWQATENTIHDLAHLSANGQRLVDKDAKTYQWNNLAWVEIVPAPFADPPLQNVNSSFSGTGDRIAIRRNSTVEVYQLEWQGFIYQLPNICINGGLQTFQQAVSPVGGVLAGPGVAQGPAPGSFVLDPSVGGLGSHTITYTAAGETYTSSFTITEPTAPTLSLPDTLVNTTMGLMSISGTGSPTGGTYHDNQGYITDDGNGLTFTISPFVGNVITNITYTSQDENGCSVSATQEIVLANEFFNGGTPYPNQIGTDLNGEQGNGQMGYAVSLSADGSRLAVSAPQVGWGEVYVYERNESGWSQMGASLVGEILQGRFGHAVKLSADGNRLIVGIPDQITNDPYRILYGTGAVHIYEWDGINWDTLGSDYQVFGWNLDNRLGETLASSQDGSVVASTISFDFANQAKVLVYRDTGEGMESSWPTIDGATAQFGSALALSATGNRIVIGEPGEESGKFYVYDWGVNGWEQIGLIEQPLAEDQFGTAVAITANGNRIVVGAPQTGQLNQPGYVQVYDWDGSTWVQMGTTVTGNFAAAHFGSSVAIDNNGLRITVGAPNGANPAPNAGRVATYEWNGSDWEEQENVIIGGNNMGDQFGFSLAASLYGDIVAVGAPQDSMLFGRGYARVFGSTTPNFQNTLPALCIDAAPSNDLSGGIPFGGVYSGEGVSDNGDGTTFTFAPAITGPGLHIITYTVDTTEVSNTIEVLLPPEVSIALPDTIFVAGGVPLSITGNGLPAGGVYSSESYFFYDNGDGLTFNFTGAHSFTEVATITYTYTNAAGCENSISQEFNLASVVSPVVSLENLAIKIFPSPVRDLLYLSGEDIKTIFLYDQTGRLLRKLPGETREFDLSNYPAGIYFISVSLRDGRMGSQRIIKE